MVRWLLGGIVAGIVYFFWGFASHMLMPIGEMGVKQIPNEDSVIGSLRGAVSDEGVYIFPAGNMSANAAEWQRETWEAKMKQGPTGFLVIHPQGQEFNFTRHLVTEVATNIGSALLAAFLLSRVRMRFAGRLLFVTLLGVFAFVTIIVPYWNWYGFPREFVIGEALDQVVGWFLAGLVLAAIVRCPDEKPAVKY
jgi:hypothetical protein